MSKDYVVVTTISSFVHKFCMHKDDLQNLNCGTELHPIEQAKDIVNLEACEMFSQKHIGETIVSADMISEKKMLELFDTDLSGLFGAENDYVKSWTKEAKISWVRRALKKVVLDLFDY